MKKTIATLAMFASASAAALPINDPNAPKPEFKTICLKVEKSKQFGSSTCDATYINEENNAKNGKNGCPAGQFPVTIRVIGEASVSSCMPPGMAQL